jgi:hypothetical protein
MSAQRGRFGCSITPRTENLASIRAFLNESAGRPLKPHQREMWLDEIRDRLGRQDIVVFGIEPRSRAARVLVEADYHMKLIGMGLEDGTLGVGSYLDAIETPTAGSLDVIRWWFTLNFGNIRTTEGRDAFELRGPGVKVLSENELLTAHGKRVHTGKSDERTLQFARGFTRHFAALAVKYPIYAELRNVFDLALVAALIRAEDLAGRIDWEMMFFGDDGKYQVDHGIAPTQVESVVNHRTIHRKHIVVGVSGGVSVDTSPLVQANRIIQDDYGLLKAERAGSAPRDLPRDVWWWD